MAYGLAGRGYLETLIWRISLLTHRGLGFCEAHAIFLHGMILSYSFCCLTRKPLRDGGVHFSFKWVRLDTGVRQWNSGTQSLFLKDCPTASTREAALLASGGCCYQEGRRQRYLERRGKVERFRFMRCKSG